MFSCLMALVYGPVWPVAWQVLSILIDPAFRVVSPCIGLFLCGFVDPLFYQLQLFILVYFYVFHFFEFPSFDDWLRPPLGLFFLPSEVLQPLRLLCTVSPYSGCWSSGLFLPHVNLFLVIAQSGWFSFCLSFCFLSFAVCTVWVLPSFPSWVHGTLGKLGFTILRACECLFGYCVVIITSYASVLLFLSLFSFSFLWWFNNVLPLRLARILSPYFSWFFHCLCFWPIFWSFDCVLLLGISPLLLLASSITWVVSFYYGHWIISWGGRAARSAGACAFPRTTQVVSSCRVYIFNVCLGHAVGWLFVPGLEELP